MAYFRPSQMIPVKANIADAEEVEEIEDSKQKKADGNVAYVSEKYLIYISFHEY